MSIVKRFKKSLLKRRFFRFLYWRTWLFLRKRRIDCFIVSPPKAGRTWVRFMLASLLAKRYGVERDLDIAAMHKKRDAVPFLVFTHGASKFHLEGNTGPIAFDHLRYSGKPVILLVRDPRDIIVSYYYHLTKRNSLYKGSLSSFIRDSQLGIKRFISFMNTWAVHRNAPSRVELVRYEDVHADTEGVLARILDFLDVEVSGGLIEEAVEEARFENMKKMEKKKALQSKRLRPAEVDDPQSFKVRKGTVGGYKEELSEEDIAYVNAAMKDLDPWFGYR